MCVGIPSCWDHWGGNDMAAAANDNDDDTQKYASYPLASGQLNFKARILFCNTLYNDFNTEMHWKSRRGLSVVRN